VQLHHIDGDRSQTTKENLAVVCLDHHHEATAGLEKGRVGLARKLTLDEVRAAKLQWEQFVASELAVPKKIVASNRRRQFEALFQYDLIKWKAEMRAASSATEVRYKFKILQEFNLEEFISGLLFRRMILKTLTDVALVSAGEMLRSVALIRVLRAFTWHLIGPPEVSISKEDKHILVESFKVLEIVGGYAACLQDNPRLLRETCTTVLQLSEICVAYRFQVALRLAAGTLRSIRKECRDYQRPRGTKLAKASAVRARIGTVDRSIKQLTWLTTSTPAP